VIDMAIGILFPQDDEQPLAPRDLNSLGDYQAAVGGTIESIDAGVEGTAFFANDEAKLIGLPINRRATLFWWLHMPSARHQDVLAGDVVLVGPSDRKGATLDVPTSLQQLLFASSSFHVELAVAGVDGWHIVAPSLLDYFDGAALALDLANQWPHVEGVRVCRSQ
jgi:hypothetical protein